MQGGAVSEPIALQIWQIPPLCPPATAEPRSLCRTLADVASDLYRPAVNDIHIDAQHLAVVVRILTAHEQRDDVIQLKPIGVIDQSAAFDAVRISRP